MNTKEKILVEGSFTYGTFQIAYGVFLLLITLILTLVGVNLDIVGEPSIILGILFIGGMGAWLIYLGYACSKWTLFVTETRVFGNFGRTEVDLPVNKITHIAKSGDKRITITTASGVINCTYCTNRDEVFSVITRLIDNRKENTSSNKPVVITPSAVSDVEGDLKKYKKLYEEGLITAEEYEAKKKKILDL